MKHQSGVLNRQVFFEKFDHSRPVLVNLITHIFCVKDSTYTRIVLPTPADIFLSNLFYKHSTGKIKTHEFLDTRESAYSPPPTQERPDLQAAIFQYQLVSA
jgi:hypothetical protein